MLKILVLCLVLPRWASANEPIPAHLKKRLREAHTFNDLTTLTSVLYSASNLMRTPPSDSNDLRIGFSRQQSRLKLQNAAFIDFHKSSEAELQVVMDDETRTNLEILSSIRQGNDTCQLQSICVPVPQDNPDPGLLIFPRCYQVTQCVGSCCDSIESCHPVAVEYLQRPIVEMLYIGNNRFAINQTRNISIEQHTACTCRDCVAPPAAHCRRGTTLGSNCNCVCDREAGVNNCRGWNRVWNDETCSCECAMKHCHGNAYVDPEQCVCRHYHSAEQHSNEPDSAGNFRAITSRLRKLRIQSRSNL